MSGVSRNWANEFGEGDEERPDSSRKSCQVWLVALWRRRFAGVAGGCAEQGGAVGGVEGRLEQGFDLAYAGWDMAWGVWIFSLPRGATMARRLLAQVSGRSQANGPEGVA